MFFFFFFYMYLPSCWWVFFFFFLVCSSYQVVSGSFRDIPGKNIGVDCHFLLQGIFLTQGSNLLAPAVARFSTAQPVVSVPFLQKTTLSPFHCYYQRSVGYICVGLLVGSLFNQSTCPIFCQYHSLDDFLKN